MNKTAYAWSVVYKQGNLPGISVRDQSLGLTVSEQIYSDWWGQTGGITPPY